MRLKFIQSGDLFKVLDLDDTEPGYNLENSWVWEYNIPKTQASMKVAAHQSCCGTKEAGTFFFRRGLTNKKKKEIAKFLVVNTMKVLRKSKEYSYLNAFFLRVGKEKQFHHHQIMKAMLDAGWVKLGKPFMNRRYNTAQRQHNLQPLLYIIQPKKRGNYYVPTNTV